jgi:transcription antitermination factor NusG
MLTMNDLRWFVAHTKPRCEKKLASWCARESLQSTLPCFRTVHKYRGKVVTFEKPLFPGYLFLELQPSDSKRVSQSDYTARVLTVQDQDLFRSQLADILKALETCPEIRMVPEIGEGSRVRVKHGPLRGLEGWVEKRHGPSTVLFRLDFIGQAAAVTMEAWDLEPA